MVFKIALMRLQMLTVMCKHRRLAEAMEEHSFPVGLVTRIQLELQRKSHEL